MLVGGERRQTKECVFPQAICSNVAFFAALQRLERTKTDKRVRDPQLKHGCFSLKTTTRCFQAKRVHKPAWTHTVTHPFYTLSQCLQLYPCWLRAAVQLPRFYKDDLHTPTFLLNVADNKVFCLLGNSAKYRRGGGSISFLQYVCVPSGNTGNPMKAQMCWLVWLWRQSSSFNTSFLFQLMASSHRLKSLNKKSKTIHH